MGIDRIDIDSMNIQWVITGWLVGGLEHDFYFSHHIGNVIIPTDEVIFFRGVGLNHQPDYY